MADPRADGPPWPTDFPDPELAARCLASVGLAESADVEVVSRGLQNIVVLDRVRGVAHRFPRRASTCRLVGRAGRRQRAAHDLGIPTPEVISVVESEQPGVAHVTMRLLSGMGLDDAVPLLPASRWPVLADDLVDLVETIHRIDARRWPETQTAWPELWDGLVSRVGSTDMSAVLPVAAVEWCREVVATAARVARNAPTTLCHGDLAGPNCRVDWLSGRVMGVLDWDSAAVADPAGDIVALLYGRPPDLQARLLQLRPEWRSDWLRYRAYVATWPIQHLLWALHAGTEEDIARASRRIGDHRADHLPPDPVQTAVGR